jgi:hypothetical protein
MNGAIIQRGLDSKGISRGVKNRARRMRRAGFAQDGKSPAFRAKQDSGSAESFSRSLQGRIHGGPGNAFRSETPVAEFVRVRE